MSAYFGREVAPQDPLIVRESGSPLYNKQSKNVQAAFANQLNRLKGECSRMGFPVADLPPGGFRDQFPDWCGGDEGDATVASVQLAHGVPHKGDKLLYKHYANRPWRKLFEKQEEFRTYCRPVLDAIREEPPLPPKMRALVELWPTLTGKKLEKVEAAAAALEVSKATVYRYLDQLRREDRADEADSEQE